MKSTGKCPKCEQTDIIRILGKSGMFGTGNNIPVGLSIFDAVLVTRYVCGRCGYSEEWIDDAGEVEKLRLRYR